MSRLFAASTLILVFTAGGCLKDRIEDATDPSTSGDPADDDGAASGGVCSAEQAAASCTDTECVFEPVDIDCTAACQNIAAVCDANACDENCSGLESDPMLCMAACEGTKTLACPNLTFGCYAQNSTCTDVGTCVDANLGG